MIEDGKSEILRLPLPLEIQTNLKDFPLKVSLALSQQFTPEYKDIPDPDGWVITHCDGNGDSYILIENKDSPVLFDIEITKTQDDEEIRKLSAIIFRRRIELESYLFNSQTRTILSLDQTPNAVQP